MVETSTPTDTQSRNVFFVVREKVQGMQHHKNNKGGGVRITRARGRLACMSPRKTTAISEIASDAPLPSYPTLTHPQAIQTPPAQR